MNTLRAALGGFLLLINSAGVLATEPEPGRWVSAGGALTEWLVLLGGESRLVGVDSTSQHSASLKALPGIGYQRQLAAEGILALRPQLLLGTEEMGPPLILEQLQAAGVQVEVLSAQPQLPALQANLQRLGQLLGAEQQAQQHWMRFSQRLQQQAQWIAQAQRQQAAPGVVLLLGHAGSSPMAAGHATSAQWLIERAGGRNLATHHGYKALSNEALLALDPQWVIVADRSLGGAEAIAALLAHNPALAATQAGRQQHLLWLDPTLLVGGLGPRLPDGLAVLSAALYPAAQPLTAQGPQ
ncbi:MAG: ABC transporter substrate-binding protein [Pseudomonadales bacterium]|nr:ABC transporter substrate-binding protein [Pseudomonadales bacterium]